MTEHALPRGGAGLQMEQDRDAPDAAAGMGYRLAAPALRARQRQSTSQAVLNFADPGWDAGPRAPDLGDALQDRWHASEEPAFSVSALLDQIRDLPWHRYLGTARRASVIGAMGAAGFAVVLYQALPRPAGKTRDAAKAEPVVVADAAPPTEAAPTPQAADAQPTATPSPAAQPPVTTEASAEPDKPADPPAPAAKPWGTEAATPVRPTAPAIRTVKIHPGAPAETPQSQPSPRPIAPRHTAQPAVRLATQIRPHAPVWHPLPHAEPAAFAHALPPHHTAVARAELPRWLTQPHATKPAVLVMSEPPHNLTLPPAMQHQAMATGPARVPSIVLPALRSPAYANAPPIQPSAAPHYSGVYYGGVVPPPVPSDPQG
jgi:hypothetical protein